MAYLLDTNIVSDLIRNPGGRAAARFEAAGEENVAISIVVAAEMRFGAARSASPVLAAKVDALLERLTVLPLQPPADRHYAELRAKLERAGTPVGANDMLIAAHALAVGRTLVTDNARAFARIKGLKTENWLR